MADEPSYYRPMRGKRATRVGVDRVDRGAGGAAARRGRRRQLLAARASARAASIGRLASRALLPIHRGVYAVGHRQSDWRALDGGGLACGPGAVLSHRSAGQLWGLLPRSARSGSDAAAQRSGRGRDPSGISRSLPKDEIEEVEGIPVTSVSRTLFDLAAIVSRRRLERAMNEAEVRRLTSRLSLPALLERYPRRRGAAILRALLRDARPRGRHPQRVRGALLALLDAHGLPRPRFNADLAVARSLLRGRLPLAAQRLIVELDGGPCMGPRGPSRPTASATGSCSPRAGG